MLEDGPNVAIHCTVVELYSLMGRDSFPLHQRRPGLDDGVCLAGSNRQWLAPVEVERLGSQLVALPFDHLNELLRRMHLGSARVSSHTSAHLVQHH